MTSIKKTARVAGTLYVFIVITGVFGLLYAPTKLFVEGNATATAAKILANESLYRIYVANGLISSLGFLFLALVLYRLFQGVHQQLATLMVILVAVQIPPALLFTMNELYTLDLVRGAGFLSVLEGTQRQALAMLYLDLNSHSSTVMETLWGLWLLPLGLLVFRSGFLPRFLGIWLIAICFAYLALSFTGLLSPQHVAAVKQIAFPVLFGEAVFAFWLLIVGARPKPAVGSAPASLGG